MTGDASSALLVEPRRQVLVVVLSGTEMLTYGCGLRIAGGAGATGRREVNHLQRVVDILA